MSYQNDENRLKKCLNEMIEIIEETNVNNQIFDELRNELNHLFSNCFNSLSEKYQNYLIYLLNDSYSFSKQSFYQNIEKNLFKQFLNLLQGIKYSFDAFQGAFDGNLSIVKHFLDQYPKYVNYCGIWGTTLLYSSSRNNHLNLVKYLVEEVQCDVNIQNKEFDNLNDQLNPTSGSTALHVACFYGHLNIVKFLILHQANYFIQNYAKETPIYNSLARENIKTFFEDYLFSSYSNSIDILPQRTILEEKSIREDSIWEYRPISSIQWILFDKNQSNYLQKSLIYKENVNYSELFLIPLNDRSYQVSLLQLILLEKCSKDYFWIRCRGSSILNFNFYSKWQILFEKDSIKSIENKSSYEVFNLHQDENLPIEIELNHWYNVNSYLQDQLENGINFRKKIIQISLPFVNNQIFTFHLRNFQFSNEDKTIEGSIRWIPIFQDINQQIIPDNFQPLDNLFCIPIYRKQQLNNQLTTINNIQTHHSEINDDGNVDVRIDVRFGDLIKETSDVIVVCWSSKYLLEMIYECGGSSVRTAINNQLEKKLKNSLTSVKADGEIKSKRIYFIYWKIQSDIQLDRKSLENLISLSMAKAHEDNYRTIAYPAIGCGHFNNSSNEIVAQIMVNKSHQEQSFHPISISFIIQSTKKDLFNYFQKQINFLTSSTSNDFLEKSIGNSIIQIEKGDITKQKVDVIVISSSSDYLRQIVLIEAGEEIYQIYEKEKSENPNSLLISTPSGNLSCKRIFFLKWNPEENIEILRQSIKDFIWNVIQNVLSCQYHSIAFPPIGSGHSNISIKIVIQTMIKQFIYQIKNRNLSLIIKFIILPDQNQIYQQFKEEILSSEQDVQLTIDDQIPSTWQMSAGKNFRFLVPFKSEEFNQIGDQFTQAMKGKLKHLIRIERIQNERWFLQYLAHKKDFFKRLNKDTEKRLYHGCPEHVQNPIIEDCFNRSFAGVNGTSFGIGVYFSSDAIYSNQFAKSNSNGEKSMFIARVLIGNTTLGNSSMKTRPPGFDTTTDGNHIFVTYHDAQAYAEYLITYK